MIARSPAATELAVNGRACPYCGSAAVRAFDRERLGGGRFRALIECGECGTVRGVHARRRAIRALERERRRERRRLARLCFFLEYLQDPEPDPAAGGQSSRR